MFYYNFVDLCNKAKKSPSAAAEDMGFKRSVVTRWSKGTKPRQATLQHIADYFGVTVDSLCAETENPSASMDKDERDILRELEKIMSALETADDLQFDGDPMSDEARESIKAAMKLGLEAAKVKNRERFTPKKYRKG